MTKRNDDTKTTKPNAYERVTQNLIDQMEAGVIPWRKPWTSAWPCNAVTGRRYTAGNAFMLACSGYSSANWLTYKQAKKLGGSVRKGQKGTPVLYFGEAKKKDRGEQARAEGENDTYRFAKVYSLFNVEQCEDLDIEEPRTDVPPLEAAESIVLGYVNAGGPRLLGAGGDMAAYVPALDAIRLPPRHSFDSSEAYYATMFHELGHSTGHKDRLAREAIVRDKLTFGDHLYSEEELVAELCAAFLCADTGVSPQPMENHAAYLGHWLKKLSDDRRLLWRAASAAQKAAGWVSEPMESKKKAQQTELKRLRAENRVLRVAVNG